MSRSRSGSVDSLFDDAEGEFDHLLDGQSTSRPTTSSRGATSNRLPASVSSIRDNTNSYRIDCRPQIARRTDDELLAIFNTYAQWKNKANERYFDERSCLLKLKGHVEDLRFSDLRGRDDLADRLLNRTSGLYAITEDTDCPWFIKLDLEELIQRWRKGDKDSYLMRGINISKGIGGKSMVTRSLDQSWPYKKPGNLQGEGHLRNGQWWPYQVCAERDNAHQAHIGGISGNKMNGATSIILSGGTNSVSGTEYEDKDEGNRVEYCGTTNNDGSPTSNTKLMYQAAKKGTPIRLMRGHRLRSPYAPADGIRYDGLYIVKDYVCLDKRKQLYKFYLTRKSGQTPIRHKGIEARPTSRELAYLERVKDLTLQGRPLRRS